MDESGIKQISAAVLGAGAWGKTFGQILIDAGWSVTWWSNDVNEIGALKHSTIDIMKAVPDADLIVLALPCSAVREVCGLLVDIDLSEKNILSLTKGLESDTLMRASEVIRDVLPVDNSQVSVLSGPNLAGELANRMPAVSVVANKDPKIAKFLATEITGPYFSVRSSTDVAGLEIAGVYKNVLAIAIGILIGAQSGGNLTAAAMVVGVKEMARLGSAVGANPATFYGMAGMGDLIATASSELSRNFAYGRSIGTTGTVATPEKTVEGALAAEAVAGLAKSKNIDAPIAIRVADLMNDLIDVPQFLNEVTEEILKG